MFGAAPQLADRLRTIAAEQFPTQTGQGSRRGSLLGRIGPALKHPIDPPEPPARPMPADVEGLLAGRAVSPERLGYAWQITLAWLADRSWGRLDLDLDPAQLNKLDFDLALAGLPASFGMERLLSRDNPQLPLRPLPGQRFGYAKHQHVEATRQALGTIISDLAAGSVPTIGVILEFLNQFPDWSQAALETGRPNPDLVAVWMG